MLNITDVGEDIFQQSEKCEEVFSNKNKEVEEVQNQFTDINSNNNAISETLISCQAELGQEDSLDPSIEVQ